MEKDPVCGMAVDPLRATTQEEHAGKNYFFCCAGCATKFRADPAKYRPEGELEKWKERDPIKIYRERLKQFGVAEETILGIDATVKREVDEATETCKAAPPPALDILTTDVYADGGFAWRN